VTVEATKPQVETLILYQGDPKVEGGQVAVATFAAHRIVVCSQYADMRGKNDELIATLTWTTPIHARKV
jgi:hypothetical protein